MTIDGINIKTVYGLKLLKECGYFDLPQRKKTIEFPAHDGAEIKLQPRTVTLSFWGSYTSEAIAGTKIAAFNTFLRAKTTHTFSLTDREISFTGACTEGSKVKLRRHVVLIDLPISVNYGMAD
jgi:hypothetical protein